MAAAAQRCLVAVIEYDGTAFAGSQVQANARTVQGELEEALNRLIGERTRVRLAGRTDAGVHATGQVAAFRLPRVLPRGGGLPELRRRLNAALPPDLAVRSLHGEQCDRGPRGSIVTIGCEGDEGKKCRGRGDKERISRAHVACMLPVRE